MLDTKLIESALALNGKKIYEMEVLLDWELDGEENPIGLYEFSIEKFCFYLLSPEFLIAYNHKMIDTRQVQHWGNYVGGTISEYQSGNDEQLSELLTKIQG